MQQQTTKEEYARLVNLAGKAAICAAALLIVVKLIAWFATGSASILAALTDSLMDVTTSVINLLAIKLALQPADENHRFGHGKAESLAGLAQAAFISGTSILLMLSGISALLHGQQIESTGVGIWVMLFSIAVTVGLVLFQGHIVKRTGSLAIKADSMHYRTDIVMNAAVLVALILASMGWHWADGLLAIMVSLYIFYGAWEIGSQSVDALMDTQLPREEEELIIKSAYQVEGVLGVHDLRTRQSGNTKFIQLHLELDDEQSLFAAHEKSDVLEAKLAQLFPHADLLIHLDPISTVEKESRQYIAPDKGPESVKDKN